MSSKRSFCCSSSYLIHILLVVSTIVEGSPFVTNPKATDSTVLKANDSPMLKETETSNQKEETTTLKGATHKIETSQITSENRVSTTVKPGKPTTTNDREGLKENDVTTKNPTSVEKIPFKPSPPIFGDLSLNPGVKKTTQNPTTIHNKPAPKDKHIKTPQSPPKSHNNPSPIRVTRIYRVKSQKGCSGKREHDIKVHVGEGRYLNIKITED